MAPGRLSKRPRAPTVDGEALSRGKRPRRSFSQESDSDQSSGDESNQSSETVAGDAHENIDEFYNRQTQRVEKELKNNELKQNIPAESGIIQEISCTNFMCHEQLTVTLGPLINFIIGHNGSGKSAVLTALTLCLGGKATATNRGQNLKSFIKEGTDNCTLRVKIKNEGSAAYKRDKYGKSIIVERHFSRAGTSGFRLKDENKRLVSTKKSDLEDIIDAFALQIDNPMNVLTQDLARQFLNDSTPKDKYKFFLKGTQLQTLREDYKLIMNELEEMESKSLTVKADVEVLRKQFEAAMEKAKRAASLERMKANEMAIAHQAAWARVEVEEEELRNVDAQIERISQLIEQRDAKADEQSEQYEIANQEYSEVNQAIQDKQAELDPKNQECMDIQGQWSETRNSLGRVLGEQRRMNDKIASKENLIAKYERQIQEQRQRQAEADGGQHAQKLDELEQAKEESERARQDLVDHEGQLAQLAKDLQSAQNRKRAAEDKVREKQNDVERARDSIRHLEQGQRDWTASYHPNLPKLLRDIDNERRFRERPVGPMGRHVKLLKPEWSSILEKSFGASLDAFVVTSKSDQTILSGMMKRLNIHYPIYIGQNTTIDTSPHEPGSDVDTWLRILTIDNNLVRSSLIINHALEQVVLIPERAKAEEFMHQGGPARRNVKMCFAMADRDRNKGHAINVNPNSGNINLGPIQAWNRKPRMQADREPQLRAARANLERYQRDLEEAQAESRELQGRVTSCQGKLEEHKRRTRSLTIRAQTAESNIERLELEISAAAPDSGMIEQLQESLREAEEEKEFDLGQLEDLEEQKNKLDETSKEQKLSLEAAQREINQLNIELGKLGAKAEKLRNKREQALREKNEALDGVHKAQENKAEWEQSRGRHLASVEEITAQALQICPRVEVPPGQTPASLEHKLQRLQREREHSERELGGSQRMLLEAANAAKKKHSDAASELARMEEVRQTLKKALTSREQRWEKFRQDISIRARITFTYLLSERQFRGQLRVDHQSQQLDIHVQPDITVASGDGRQTKTLSGGEKSFSTICLLLSLWDAMGSPIRCLDEFDVFMDNVNRDISMKMMIGAARRAIGRQYILITPQAMNSIQSVGDVKIIKMQDPERGQTALNVNR